LPGSKQKSVKQSEIRLRRPKSKAFVFSGYRKITAQQPSRGGVPQPKPDAESGAEKLALGMQLRGRDNADSHIPSSAML
jgi:hypothetical protein